MAMAIVLAANVPAPFDLDVVGADIVVEDVTL